MGEMNREDWLRVDRLFAAAQALPPTERELFVRDSGASAEIIERALRLLQAEKAAGERIGESAGPLASEVMQTDDDTGTDFGPGSRIGPYQVVRELGRGGMGTVYLAERSDEKYDRAVALKVVKRGMDTDEIIARFRREGRILARLEHPLIGRMYDADVTDDGRPYLVLEYIDGAPIDVHCDARRLTVNERLELFVRVCEAVSFAHNKLVLHRDLKPSNILVTDEGPRLLDFGVAKILDESEEETRDLTAIAGRRLTPEYASPEQLSGDSISTASDVYSLGVVLFELLTGMRPTADRTRLASAAVTDEAETRDPVTGTDAASSRRTTTQKLARRLHGDLDVILAKTLHREVERRYASVEALVADVRRHLDGLPVTARPDSVAYRARKFISRNRLPVFSGSGIGISVLIFAIASFVQQAETARERDRANVERARAEEIAGVLEEMFTGAGFESQDRIDTLSVREFLDRSAADVVEGLQDQPVVQGTLLRVLGTAQSRVGRIEEADSLLTRSVRVMEGAPGEDPAELLRAQRALGNLRMEQGRFSQARELYETWLASSADAAPADAAILQHNIGMTLFQQGHLDSAAIRLDRAIELHREAPDVDLVGLAQSFSMRGGVAQRGGDLSAALAFAKEGVDVMSKAVGADHPRMLSMEANYAFALNRSGDGEGAEPLFRSLVERYRAVSGPSTELSTLLQNYGSVLRGLGRPEDGLPFIEEAVAFDRLMPGSPARTYSLDALGTTLMALERPIEARAVFLENLEYSRETFGAEYPPSHVAAVKVATASCLVPSADAEEVLGLFQTAESGITRIFPSDHPAIADLWYKTGQCLMTLDRPDAAAPYLEQAVDALVELTSRGGPSAALATARELLEQARAGNN